MTINSIIAAETYNRFLAQAEATGEVPKMTRPELAEVALTIALEYQEKYLTLTVRQLYYQMISRGLSANGQPHYDRIGETLANARLRGDFPMNLIEDRGRTVGNTDATSSSIDVDEALDYAAQSIRSMPRWQINRAHWYGQDTVPSVWIEKEALTGIFSSACNQARVGLFACKGYSSVSALFEWVKFADAQTEDDSAEAVVLYFGDHDPDGMEIPLSAERNITLMLKSGVVPGRCPAGQTWNDKEDEATPLRFRIERIGLTLEQIRQFNPPSYPAKKTSSRYKKYIASTGIEEAWELDALDPEEMQRLVRDHTDRLFDREVARSNRRLLRRRRDEMIERMQDADWMADIWS